MMTFLKSATNQRGTPRGKPKTTFFGEAVKKIDGQRGALFGLDARIALAIFGGLSALAGIYGVAHINTFKAQGFAEELQNVKTAIEGYHYDLKLGLYATLITANADNAFTALYDDSVITSTYRGRWLGPYTDFTSNTHHNYGTMAIDRALSDHTSSCGSPCQLWLTFSSVPDGTVQALNEIFDGAAEANPDTSGRLQWAGAGPYTVWFHISKEL